MADSWLDKSHRYAKEEFEVPLKRFGFKKYGNSLIRIMNGNEQHFRIQWTPFGSREHNFNYFWFVGDEYARKYISIGTYYCGDDLAQVFSFINSGNDDFAETVLNPIGLFELYKDQLSKILKSSRIEPYCISFKKYSNNIKNSENKIQLLKWNHRHRWSSEDSFRNILQADLKSFLIFFDLSANLSPSEKKFTRILKKELIKSNLIFYN
ncbi:MAG: hypothetical protein WAU11_03445 [Ignavibacteriaceae bacterium]